MDEKIKGLVEEYKFARLNSKIFIKNLGEEELKKKLPRAGLNTFTKHFEEMIDFELDIIEAIETGEMRFNNSKDIEVYAGQSKVDELLGKITEADKKLFEVLDKVNINHNVLWEFIGKERSILEHISFFISHEMLHVGQLIAFSYVLNIEIPADIVEFWALSKQ